MSVLPPCAGIGVRAAHYAAVLAHPAAPGWYEVHSENFFAEGGPALQVLDRLAERAPISLHGVGLGLGSTAPIDAEHLRSLQRLVQRCQPASVSEHVCWGHVGSWHANDLLPMPYTMAAAAHLAGRIGEVQDALGRRILIENVSCYLRFAEDVLSEWEFVVEVCRRAGCGLLLDVNNVHVNAVNHGFSGLDFLAGIPPDLVGEFHLAGHAAGAVGLIDTHAAPVAAPVWALFEAALQRCGARPTLVEWDHQLPDFEVLLAEGAAAQRRLDAHERAEATLRARQA